MTSIQADNGEWQNIPPKLPLEQTRCPPKSLKFPCKLAREGGGNYSPRCCSLNLASEVCLWLQKIDGCASASFIEKLGAISPGIITQLLGYVDSRGRILPRRLRTIQEKLDNLVEAGILKAQDSLTDTRERVYGPSKFAPLIFAQCKEWAPIIVKKRREQDKKLRKEMRESDRAKGIQKRLRETRGNGIRDARKKSRDTEMHNQIKVARKWLRGA